MEFTHRLILDNNHQTVRFHFNMHQNTPNNQNNPFLFNCIPLNVIRSGRDLGISEDPHAHIAMS